MAKIAEWFLNHRALNNGTHKFYWLARRIPTLFFLAKLAQSTIFYLIKLISSLTEKIKTNLTVKKLEDGFLAYYEGSKVIATSPKPHLTDAKGKVVYLSYALSRDKLTISLPSLKGLRYPLTFDPFIFYRARFQGNKSNVDF